MGYSYRASAGRCWDAILAAITDPKGTSNGWEHAGCAYFVEQGREQADGAITGTVWRYLPDGQHIRRAGSMRIDPDGRLVRWPCISKSVRADVLARYMTGRFSDQAAGLAFHAERVLAIQRQACEAWREACAFDGIPPDSQFVQFSDGNPAAERYNSLMLMLTH